jgi:calcium binding protein 39
MPFLHLLKDKPRSAEEVVGKACQALEAQAQANSGNKEKAVEKAKEDVERYLNFLKQWLFGDEAQGATRENAIAIAAEACRSELLRLMVTHIAQLDFEARKDVAQIFGAIVRIKDADEQPIGAQFLREHPDVLGDLIDGWVRPRRRAGRAPRAPRAPRLRRPPRRRRPTPARCPPRYDDANVALNCGSMLRDCLRDEVLSRCALPAPAARPSLLGPPAAAPRRGAAAAAVARRAPGCCRCAARPTRRARRARAAGWC